VEATMTEQGKGPQPQGEKKVLDEERGVIRYETPRGDITLTTAIVRKFFLANASDLEAMAFAGFCKWSGLNPFLREVYLTKMGNEDQAQIIVAYSSFMKRAERAKDSQGPLYKGFKAGIVLAPVRSAPIASQPEQPPAEPVLPVQGVAAVVPAPFIAIEGTLVPPGHALVGGWCLVWRRDRGEEPAGKAVVSVKEYTRRRRDGAIMKNWDPDSGMPATMIRKTAIGHGHREAFSDELAGFYLEEELPPREELRKEPVAQPEMPTAAEDVVVIPEALQPLFVKLEWSRGKVEMWLARYRESTLEEQLALLQKEVPAAAMPVTEAVPCGILQPVAEGQAPRLCRAQKGHEGEHDFQPAEPVKEPVPVTTGAGQEAKEPQIPLL
jgi:phage recombination protein Bet